MKKLKRWKKIVLLGLAIVIVLTLAVFYLTKTLNAWFDHHYLQFNKTLTVELAWPVEAKEREYPTEELARILEEIPAPEDLKSDEEKAIYEVFGLEDYRFAIAIARAESGLRRGAFNRSSDDVGLFQINWVHWSPDSPSYKEECDLSLISTLEGNARCAYRLFTDSGWGPWVVYTKGIVK